LKTQITYPAGPIDTLSPVLAFISTPHEAIQAELSGALEWSSGVVDSRAFRLSLPALSSGEDYSLRVRVRDSGAWGDWSEPVSFTTPKSPVVRLVSPTDAGRAIGPNVDIRWDVESDSPLDSLLVTVDGKPLGSGVECRAGSQSARVHLKQGLHSVEVRAISGGQEASVSSRFWVWTSPQAKGDLVVLDLTEIGSWDVARSPETALRMYDLLHAASCLQGIVNRKGPRLMLRLYDDVDDFWLNFLREDGAWLQNINVVTLKQDGRPEEAFLRVLAMFRREVKGLVAWDPAVPATSNVATTAAGVEDLLPVRAGAGTGSLADSMAKLGLKLKLDLAGKFTGSGLIPDSETKSTGSAKCDAYLWAKARYLDTGRANARCLGYWLDAFWLKHPGRMPWWENCLSNHDWIVQGRGFLFDLSNWGDEAPQDDSGQPVGTDLETFRAILLSAYNRSQGKMIHVSGFTPWAFKYTDHAQPKGSHEPVPTEWEVVRVLSAYNAYLDADAHGLSAMSNASLWTGMPQPDRYVQNPPPTRADLIRKGYLTADGSLAPLGYMLFYIGDFDSAAWLTRRLPDLWDDPVRGSVPMGWAFNPNLSARNPAAFLYAFRKMSESDYFTGGDSGAGYVNPTMLLEPRPISGLPSGADAWVEHCRDLYRRFNYRITGFLINGHAGKLTPASEEMTALFSPDGTATQRAWMDGEGHLRSGMPVALQMHDLCPDITASVDCISGYRRAGLQFLDFRMILLGPQFARDFIDGANARRPDAPMELLDPYSFFYLLRHHLGGANERRATFTFDTVGPSAAAGQRELVRIGVRNDGWDTWKAGKAHLLFGVGRSVDWASAERVDLPHDVAPGQAVVLEWRVTLPEAPGSYLRYYGMADQRGAFHGSGCPWWESSLELR